jgi:hypothetical protein
MGGPTSGRRSASYTPGYPAPHRRRCQGKAATHLQRSRPEPDCSGNASPRDVGAINHRGAANSGRVQESPGRRRGPTGRKLRLLKAGVPLGTSRRDFPIHAGSLGPHRAHAQHTWSAWSTPRPSPNPRPSSPTWRASLRRYQTWSATPATSSQRRRLNPSPSTPAATPPSRSRSASSSIPNRKQCSSTFSARTPTFSRGVPRTCPAYRGMSPSTRWIFELELDP